MLTRMLAAGLLAGVLAGILVSGLQHFSTVPLILKAETYETAGAKAASLDRAHSNTYSRHPGEGRDPDNSEFRAVSGLKHGARDLERATSEAVWIPAFAGMTDKRGAPIHLVHGGEDHKDAAAAPVWSPADGLQRTLATSVTTIGTAVGFALMLLAAMIALDVRVTPRSALMWGVAGFFATGLATAFGLPPKLPGSASADLVPSQLWWAGTAVSTALGIWLLMKPGVPRIAAGLVLIAAPHIIGAPQVEAFASAVPAELAAKFTAASLAVHAVLWTLTGALTGYFWTRLKGPATLEV